MTGVLLLGDTLVLGGTEGQFAEVACGLDRSRWDLHVSCLKAEGPLRSRLEAAGVRPWSSGAGTFKSPRFALAAWRLARYVRTHRIRLVHSFDFYSNVMGMFVARLARVPVIASQRDMGDMRPGARGRLQRASLRVATRVLVNAEAIRARLAAEGVVPAARLSLIRNGVDLERFRPAPPAGGPPRYLAGTVTNLRPEKGLDGLLRALAMVHDAVPPARFVIWGDGRARRELEALAVSLGLGTAVDFPGHTPRVQDVLGGMRIFAFPPRSNEGLSNALLEAMAVGLPVVATSVGGNGELVEDERTGLLVPPDDPAALAKALLRMAEQPELAAQLGAAGRHHVRNEYGIPRMLERTESLYRQVLAEGRR